MSERFQKLYELPHNLYSQGSPIIVEAGALLKDTQSGKLVVQLKFHSVTETPIKALKVLLTTFDYAGTETLDVVEYQYLDLTIQNGTTFGSNKAIAISNDMVRSFAIKEVTAIAAYNVSLSAGVPWVQLPTAKTLQSVFGDENLVNLYRFVVHKTATFMPVESSGLWQCACGKWNRTATCTNCRAEKNHVFATADIDQLRIFLAKRQEARRLDAERTAQELAAKKQKNKARIKKYLLLLLVTLLLAGAIWGGIKIAQPESAKEYAQEDIKTNTELIVADTPEPEPVTVPEPEPERSFLNTISAGHRHTVGLKDDGTVVAVGDFGDGQCYVSDWTDIVSLAAGIYYTVGLKEDGTVVTAGGNYYGQCNVSSWTNITAITAGFGHTVGLKSDGTVLATGWNDHGQCEVSAWTDIVSVAAGHKHTVGLKADGTVVATGDNSYSRCEVSTWRDIVAVATGIRHTVGLKSDGTVVATGANGSGQCNVSTWTDIVAIAAGEDFTIGLQANGNVVAVGDNWSSQCDVASLNNIVSIAAGESHTVALRADGTAVAVGLNDYGQCNISDWKNLRTITPGTINPSTQSPTNTPISKNPPIYQNGLFSLSPREFGERINEFVYGADMYYNADGMYCGIKSIIDWGDYKKGDAIAVVLFGARDHVMGISEKDSKTVQSLTAKFFVSDPTTITSTMVDLMMVCDDTLDDDTAREVGKKVVAAAQEGDISYTHNGLTYTFTQYKSDYMFIIAVAQ